MLYRVQVFSGLLAALALAAGMSGGVGAAFDWAASAIRSRHYPAPPAEVAADLSEQSFSQMMISSMSEMNRGAQGTPLVGDPDRDFAAMMIIHHLGAVAMAKAQLLHGKDPVLRRLAQEIVVTQTAEIAVLRDQLGPNAAVCGR